MARILIIDDELSIRTIVGRALTAAGHAVILAADGREGLQAHRAQAVDLVISDLFMPNKDGFEAIAEFSKLSPKVPVIVMSGQGSAEPILAMARALGASAALGKPFSNEELFAAVHEALGAGGGSAQD